MRRVNTKLISGAIQYVRERWALGIICSSPSLIDEDTEAQSGRINNGAPHAAWCS